MPLTRKSLQVVPRRRSRSLDLQTRRSSSTAVKPRSFDDMYLDEFKKVLRIIKHNADVNKAKFKAGLPDYFEKGKEYTYQELQLLNAYERILPILRFVPSDKFVAVRPQDLFKFYSQETIITVINSTLSKVNEILFANGALYYNASVTDEILTNTFRFKAIDGQSEFEVFTYQFLMNLYKKKGGQSGGGADHVEGLMNKVFPSSAMKGGSGKGRGKQATGVASSPSPPSTLLLKNVPSGNTTLAVPTRGELAEVAAATQKQRAVALVSELKLPEGHKLASLLMGGSGVSDLVIEVIENMKPQKGVTDLAERTLPNTIVAYAQAPGFVAAIENYVEKSKEVGEESVKAAMRQQLAILVKRAEEDKLSRTILTALDKGDLYANLLSTVNKWRRNEKTPQVRTAFEQSLGDVLHNVLDKVKHHKFRVKEITEKGLVGDKEIVVTLEQLNTMAMNLPGRFFKSKDGMNIFGRFLYEINPYNPAETKEWEFLQFIILAISATTAVYTGHSSVKEYYEMLGRIPKKPLLEEWQKNIIIVQNGKEKLVSLERADGVLTLKRADPKKDVALVWQTHTVQEEPNPTTRGAEICKKKAFMWGCGETQEDQSSEALQELQKSMNTTLEEIQKGFHKNDERVAIAAMDLAAASEARRAEQTKLEPKVAVRDSLKTKRSAATSSISTAKTEVTELTREISTTKAKLQSQYNELTSTLGGVEKIGTVRAKTMVENLITAENNLQSAEADLASIPPDDRGKTRAFIENTTTAVRKKITGYKTPNELAKEAVATAKSRKSEALAVFGQGATDVKISPILSQISSDQDKIGELVREVGYRQEWISGNQTLVNSINGPATNPATLAHAEQIIREQETTLDRTKAAENRARWAFGNATVAQNKDHMAFGPQLAIMNEFTEDKITIAGNGTGLYSVTPGAPPKIVNGTVVEEGVPGKLLLDQSQQLEYTPLPPGYVHNPGTLAIEDAGDICPSGQILDVRSGCVLSSKFSRSTFMGFQMGSGDANDLSTIIAPYIIPRSIGAAAMMVGLRQVTGPAAALAEIALKKEDPSLADKALMITATKILPRTIDTVIPVLIFYSPEVQGLKSCAGYYGKTSANVICDYIMPAICIMSTLASILQADTTYRVYTHKRKVQKAEVDMKKLIDDTLRDNLEANIRGKLSQGFAVYFLENILGEKNRTNLLVMLQKTLLSNPTLQRRIQKLPDLLKEKRSQLDADLVRVTADLEKNPGDKKLKALLEEKRNEIEDFDINIKDDIFTYAAEYEKTARNKKGNPINYEKLREECLQVLINYVYKGWLRTVLMYYKDQAQKTKDEYIKTYRKEAEAERIKWKGSLLKNAEAAVETYGRAQAKLSHPALSSHEENDILRKLLEVNNTFDEMNKFDPAGYLESMIIGELVNEIQSDTNNKYMTIMTKVLLLNQKAEVLDGMKTVHEKVDAAVTIQPLIGVKLSQDPEYWSWFSTNRIANAIFEAVDKSFTIDLDALDMLKAKLEQLKDTLESKVTRAITEIESYIYPQKQQMKQNAKGRSEVISKLQSRIDPYECRKEFLEKAKADAAKLNIDTILKQIENINTTPDQASKITLFKAIPIDTLIKKSNEILKTAGIGLREYKKAKQTPFEIQQCINERSKMRTPAKAKATTAIRPLAITDGKSAKKPSDALAVIGTPGSRSTNSSNGSNNNSSSFEYLPNTNNNESGTPKVENVPTNDRKGKSRKGKSRNEVYQAALTGTTTARTKATGTKVRGIQRTRGGKRNVTRKLRKH